jgi:type I restriction enzyme S subunit
MRAEFERFRTGSTHKTIYMPDIKALQIVLPPSVPMQRAIADFLDKKTAAIDALIAKKERLIGLLQEKRQALITQAVTKGLDPTVPMKDSGFEWIGEMRAHWPCAPLYAHFDVQLGKMLDAKRDVGRELYPYLRNANVSWDGVDIGDVKEMSLDDADRVKYRLRAGDLLVCEGGANAQVVGKSAIWSGEIEECYYQKALHRVRPRASTTSSKYLWYALWAAWGRGLFAAEASPTTVLHLTAEMLRAHRFPFPPPDEQREIVERLDASLMHIGKIVIAASEVVRRLREYRQALITAAVTGKLDISTSTSSAATMPALEGAE